MVSFVSMTNLKYGKGGFAAKDNVYGPLLVGTTVIFRGLFWCRSAMTQQEWLSWLMIVRRANTFENHEDDNVRAFEGNSNLFCVKRFDK
ncbi:hypothetical protein E2542_SST30322 [Spatholobus suberectus]|nr:hypothetical protein E2542_SST30322 [Spatholobus suberectus]